jgi:hypothetical protein
MCLIFKAKETIVKDSGEKEDGIYYLERRKTLARDSSLVTRYQVIKVLREIILNLDLSTQLIYHS